MMTIGNFKGILPRKLINMARQYLLEEHTIRIAENDEGCYDAAIREGNKEHWVEVTLALGTEDVIEDCYCSKCNSLRCVHTVAVLLLISENTKINAKGYSNNIRLLPS
ncbi:MAG: hypothetical protein ABFC62_08375 [Clostridiaceae bacterium]